MEQLYNPAAAAPPRYPSQDTLQQSQPQPAFSPMPPPTSWPAIPTAIPQKPAASKGDDISDFFSSLISSSPAPSTSAPASTASQSLPPSYSANRPTPSIFNTTAPGGTSISPIASAIPSTPSMHAASPGMPASPLPVHSSVSASVPVVPSPAPAAAPSASYSSQVGDIAVQLSNFVRKVDDNFDKVTKHLLEIERRLNNLELSSRELTEQQKSVLEKLQHSVAQPSQPVAAPPSSIPYQAQPVASRPVAPPSYAPPPTVGALSYSTYVPPATSAGMMNLPMKLPQLQPVGGSSGARPSVDQMELDRQLALRLQEEINRAEGGSSVTPGGPSDGLLPGVDTKSLYSGGSSSSSSSGGKEECPFCGLGLPIAQLEAHVNKHLDDPSSIPATGSGSKDADRGSILGWLFNRKADNTAKSGSSPSSSPTTSKPPTQPLAAPKPPPQQMMAPQYSSIYPGNSTPIYRVPQSQLPPGVQIPPGMQIATIPAGAPIPPGAVPLSAVAGGGAMPYTSVYPYAQ